MSPHGCQESLGATTTSWNHEETTRDENNVQNVGLDGAQNTAKKNTHMFLCPVFYCNYEVLGF